MAAPIKFPFRPRGGQPREDTTPKRGLRRYLLELKESNKEFWLSGHAVFKLLSLGCMISALDYFETMLPHPVLILLICMEAAICIFFIFLNTLAINRYIPFVFWPMALLVSRDPSVLRKTTSTGGKEKRMQMRTFESRTHRRQSEKDGARVLSEGAEEISFSLVKGKAR
uniref:CKLF-like MARVEL transmembrane domain containing 2A n=2 Tax=Mus musculus TaxID=10090 RepID=A0A1D5RMK3_MOUSE